MEVLCTFGEWAIRKCGNRSWNTKELCMSKIYRNKNIKEKTKTKKEKKVEFKGTVFSLFEVTEIKYFVVFFRYTD